MSLRFKHVFMLKLFLSLSVVWAFFYIDQANFKNNVLHVKNHKPLPTTPNITHEDSDPFSLVCSAIINGDKNATQKIKTQPLDASDDEIIADAKKGCFHIVNKYSFRYHWKEVSKEEENYPIAYTILAHYYTEQLLLLLAEIYSPQNVYCIHIDSKSEPSMIEAIRLVIKCFPNILLALKRENVTYASFSRLQADINCMKDLLQSPVKWKHLINLCGQDFPIKTNFDIVSSLKKLNGRNLIASNIQSDPHQLRRTKYVHKIETSMNEGRLQQTIIETPELKSPPPFNLTVMKNLAYNVYSRSFLQWALLDSDKSAILLNWSRDTKTPDEHYWAMLDSLEEAPGRTGKITRTPLYPYIIWFNSKRQCSGYWHHYNCVYGKDDVVTVLKQPKLFANKFDIKFDSLPVVCIQEWLRDRRDKQITIYSNKDKMLLNS